MATTKLYAPRPVDAFDPGIAGVAPILATGTDVDNTKLTAVQAAAVAAGLGTLATSAGGTAPTPVAEPLRFRGAWQASTAYSYGDVVVQGGVQYVAPMSFTSGLSFVSANWTRLGTYDGTDASLSGAFDAAGAAAAAQTAAQSFATAAIATQSTADRASYLPLQTDPQTITYNADGTVATVTVQGVTTTYTYNADGTVATETRAGVTRTYTYVAGNLTAVA